MRPADTSWRYRRRVRIGVLGPLEVHADSGELLPLTGARLRTLLIRLALDPDRVVTTRQLIDAVWGDDPPAAAPNALQALVSRLRRALPDLPVTSDPAGYRLALDPDAVDAHRFERLVRAGNADLPEALALWRGPALADVTEADYARGPVARLTELRLTALEDAAEARLGTPAADGAPGGGAVVAELEALNREHPTRERLTGLLMRALCLAGRPADALAAYEHLRERLAEDLGTDPSGELAQLQLAILRGTLQPGQTPAGPTAVVVDPPRTNLRAGLTSFVGRDNDVARVTAMVTTTRLVTLVGPGGAGKTRLAVEAARTLLRQFPDGVWFVELAPVTDPNELTATVLSTLGLREQALLPQRTLGALISAGDPSSRLISGLHDKDLLIVLDNCEHLIGKAATLADDVLGSCPGVRVLATSREPLALTGESLWTVDSLGLPGADDPPEVGRFAAIRLFADRATAARADFRVDATNVAVVADLCRALDGMPLAIELAAARLRTMTLGQIADRLDDRFRLLVGGSRTALPRHQTLRAVVDWSWDLLDEPERTLWRRLSVFAGGATLSAAEAVCGLGDSTMDIALALADKSLLTISDGLEPRFDMLETIRAYGRERLADAGSKPSDNGGFEESSNPSRRGFTGPGNTAGHHAEEPSDLTRPNVKKSDDATGPDLEETSNATGRRVEEPSDLGRRGFKESSKAAGGGPREPGNAVESGAEEPGNSAGRGHDGPGDIARRGGAESGDASGRGLEEPAVRSRHVQYFLALAETAEPFLRTNEQIAWLARLAADHDNLQAALRRAIGDGDAATAARLVASVGWYWWLGGHRAEGAELAVEALALPGPVDAEVHAAAYAIAALNALDVHHDMSQARRWVMWAKRLTRQVERPRPVLRLLDPLSQLMNPAAEASAARAIALLFDDPDRWVRATARLIHAHAVLNLGHNHEQADLDLAEAFANYAALGERWGLSATLAAVAEQASRAGDYERAATCLTEALAHLRSLGANEDAPQFQVQLAHQRWLLGDRAGAAELLDDAEREAERLGLREGRASVWHARAEQARHRGHTDEAQRLLDRAMSIVDRGFTPPQVMAMFRTSMGYLAVDQGDLDAARRHLREAIDEAVHSQDAPIIGLTLVGAANLALSKGRPRDAALLLGAATAVRGRRDESIVDLPGLEAAALAALGEADFTEAHQRGLAYTTVDDAKRLTA
jgi:predicted ATPase/DNA-binding SARP family transcriptional activator